MADHDSGLIALQAGDFERAATLLHNALEQRPPIQRAHARLRRAEALAQLGRADDADAEIRAATQEPVRPADRPAVLVARMTFAQALAARARGRHDLADRRLREAEAPLASARRPTLAAISSARSSIWAPARRRRRRPATASWNEIPGTEPMPTFADVTTSTAPVEEVWKLLYDPSRFPEWWEGMETVSSRARTGSRCTRAAIRTFRCHRPLSSDDDGHRVTISCLDQLPRLRVAAGADAAATVRGSSVHVEIPEAEAHRLDTQREAVSASLRSLRRASPRVLAARLQHGVVRRLGAAPHTGEVALAQHRG